MFCLNVLPRFQGICPRKGRGPDGGKIFHAPLRRAMRREMTKAGGHCPRGRRDPRSTRGDRESNAKSRLFARELLDDFQRFRHVLIGRNAVVLG